MPDYLTYPFKTMNLTQKYNVGNHLAHNSGTPKDYPLDEAGAGTGRDYFYCPCKEMKIVKLYGNTSIGYHIWLESTAKVNFADGSSNYVTILAVHMNDDDYKKLKVGQKYKRGDKMFREGTTGKATGNHCHFAAGKGKSSANGIYWVQNSKGSWVLVTPNGTVKPEKAFYVDKAFTKVKNSAGLKFKDKPTEAVAKVYKTTVDTLNLRSGIGTGKSILITVPEGKQVEMIKQNAGSANGYSWDQIKYSGKTGYVASKYLSELKKTTDAVNMRSSAGTSKSILLTIPKAKTVEVLTANAASANGYTWSKIKYSGKTGYVASKYLK